MNSILAPILILAVVVLICGIIAHFLTNLVRKKTSDQVVVNIAFAVFIFLFLFLFFMWGSHPSKILRPSNLQRLLSVMGQETTRTYYPNGQIKEEYGVKDGRREGFMRKYYENGVLQEEAMYKNGALEGPYKFYYKNGQLFTEGFFRNGTVDGPVKEYYKDGKLFAQDVFKDGKPIQNP